MKIPRREFLKQTITVTLAPLFSTEAIAAAPSEGLLQSAVEPSPQEAVLENDLLRAVFDTNSGALLELLNRQTGRRFQGRREVACSFFMVVPLPERMLHIIDGTRQKTANHRSLSNRLEFTWDALESPYVGRMDIGLIGSVTLSDSGLTFEMSIRNGSPYRVESVAWPYIGDLERHSSGEFHHASYNYCLLRSFPLSPTFQNERRYWGTEFPIQMVPTPESPWVLILNEAEGLYVGCHEVTAKKRVEFTFRLKPGFENPPLIPAGDMIGGKVGNLEFFPTHLSFVMPGESGSLSPIILKPFRGDWHAGADIYKA
jgi:hypothetical protein